MTLKNLRKFKAMAQGGRCYYCQHPCWANNPLNFARKHRLTVSQAKWFRQTAEHLVPVSEGGKNTRENIVMACHYCNSRRHRCRNPLSASTYLRKVQERVAGGRWHGCAVKFRLTAPRAKPRARP